jgi:Trk K+ transport system NAD-binding subunit
MKKTPLSDRLRYIFDNTLSRGPIGLISWLAVATGVLVLLLALTVQMVHVVPDMSFPAIVWTMLLQALAPNPVDVKAGPVGFLIAMLLITLIGLFMVSIFIGILTTAIESRIQSLRKGRSKVIETGHTVILGWDEHIFLIIHELAVANQFHKKSCVVILGEKDKIEMEDEIRDKAGFTGKMKVVCRSGSSIDPVSLDIVSVNTAKSIIILAPDNGDPDPFVIKTLLAITNSPTRRKEKYHIVAEVHDPRNLDAIRLVANGETELVLINDVISRIIAQTTRQSGLSVVYSGLLDFEGDEIYFKEEPGLVGKTFREGLLAYADSSVIGIRPAGEKPVLNPEMERVIQAGDKVIAISEDDETLIIGGDHEKLIQREVIHRQQQAPFATEKTLILGWNKYGIEIIIELDRYVAPGSIVAVVAEHDGGFPRDRDIVTLRSKLENQSIEFHAGNTTDRHTLEKLGIEGYSHVIVLAYSDQMDAQSADSCTLITLLHLRDIADHAGHTFTIVSEMRDSQNRLLAEVTRADDFIVSDNLASLILAQISENYELNIVFSDLFSRGGADIYLKPVHNYLDISRPVNFYTVVAAAALHGEVAFGYRQMELGSQVEKSYGVVVNPDKWVEIQFSDRDKIIVLAGN